MISMISQLENSGVILITEVDSYCRRPLLKFVGAVIAELRCVYRDLRTVYVPW
jgi:hypothetical protein